MLLVNDAVYFELHHARSDELGLRTVWLKAYMSSPRLESDASYSLRDCQSQLAFDHSQRKYSHQDLPR